MATSYRSTDIVWTAIVGADAGRRPYPHIHIILGPVRLCAAPESRTPDPGPRAVDRMRTQLL